MTADHTPPRLSEVELLGLIAIWRCVPPFDGYPWACDADLAMGAVHSSAQVRQALADLQELRALIREAVDIDPRLSYLELQVPRALWEELG